MYFNAASNMDSLSIAAREPAACESKLSMNLI